MRTYELVVVFDSGLEIEQIETDLKKLQEIITRQSGFVRVWERWGKRRLAYEIQRRQYGYYTLVVFDVEAELVAELDRIIRITPTIIRHLLTVVEPKRAPEIDEESVRTLGAARPGALGGDEPADAVAETVAAETDADATEIEGEDEGKAADEAEVETEDTKTEDVA